MHPEELLEFWFEDPTRWYSADSAFDREVKERFEGALRLAARGQLEQWRTSPRGRLAFVILLDQLSRNMYRGTPNAFSQDPRALEAALHAIAAGDEDALSVAERSFLYMPLEHAEDVERQRECVAAFERLRADAGGGGSVDSWLDYARRHAAIVERFGRFPHRNAILGRSSTPEEIAFLKEPNSSF